MGLPSQAWPTMYEGILVSLQLRHRPGTRTEEYRLEVTGLGQVCQWHIWPWQEDPLEWFLLRQDVFSPNEQLGIASTCVGKYWCQDMV